MILYLQAVIHPVELVQIAGILRQIVLVELKGDFIAYYFYVNSIPLSLPVRGDTEYFGTSLNIRKALIKGVLDVDKSLLFVK